MFVNIGAKLHTKFVKKGLYNVIISWYNVITSVQCTT